MKSRVGSSEAEGGYRFNPPLKEGRILSRPNRFIMMIRAGGRTMKCHCPTTGRIGDIELSGLPCLYSTSANTKRKTAHTVEAISTSPAKRSWVGINQTASNRYLEFFLRSGALSKMVSGTVTREVKLGRFLKSLSREERGRVSIATKFGEHWNFETGEPFVDHSYDALCRSLDRSLERLGTIDLPQLHRTTPAVLGAADLQKAWEYARLAGVGKIGVSASDPASAVAALALGYTVLQMPYNVSREDMGPAVREAASKGVELLINRPYQAGAKLYDMEQPDKRALFAHVLKVTLRGWVLTGTRSADHLKENIDAFRAAQELSEAA